MVFEDNTPDVIALLMAHTGGYSLVVVVVPHPPTLAPTRASFIDAADNKRKKAQGEKSAKGAEEREATQSFYQPPAKEVRIGRGATEEKHIFSDLERTWGRPASQALCLEVPIHP